MTSASSNIRLVLLDADGVVQEPSSDWLPTVELVCGDPERAAEFLKEFYATEAMFMTGNEGVGSALGELASAWNPPCSIEEAMQLWWCITKNKEIFEVIAAMRAGGTLVALASNQQPERARYMSQVLGYEKAFDQCFYSCHLGCAKPDPEYFLSILQRIGIPEGEVLFLDDRSPNVEAAKSMGIHAEVFDISSGIDAFINILERYGLYRIPKAAKDDV